MTGKEKLLTAGVSAIEAVGSIDQYWAKATELVTRALAVLSESHPTVRCAVLLATADWCNTEISVSLEVRRALRDRLGYDVPLIGGSTPLIYCSEYRAGVLDRGMTLILFCSNDMRVTVGCLEKPYDGDDKTRQRRVNEFATNLTQNAGIRLGYSANRHLFGILPGFRPLPNNDRICRDNELFQELLAAFSYRYRLFGASAANAIPPTTGYQFSDEKCLESGLVLAIVENDLRAGTVMTHGFSPAQDVFLTVDELADDSGYVIARLDGMSATKRLQEVTPPGADRVILGQPSDDDFNAIFPTSSLGAGGGNVRVNRKISKGERLRVLVSGPVGSQAATVRAIDEAIESCKGGAGRRSLDSGFFLRWPPPRFRQAAKRMGEPRRASTARRCPHCNRALGGRVCYRPGAPQPQQQHVDLGDLFYEPACAARRSALARAPVDVVGR